MQFPSLLFGRNKRVSFGCLYSETFKKFLAPRLYPVHHLAMYFTSLLPSVQPKILSASRISCHVPAARSETRAHFGQDRISRVVGSAGFFS